MDQREKQVSESGKMALGPHGLLGLPIGRVGLQTKEVCRLLALLMVRGQWRMTPRQDQRLGGQRTYCQEARGWQCHVGARQAQARLWTASRRPRKGAELRHSLPRGER